MPARLLAFGDELSLLTTQGRRYAINGLDANNAVDCGGAPVGFQYLAATRNYVMAECPGTATEFKAVSRATLLAQSTDIEAQVDAQIANGGINGADLAFVLVGIHDVLNLYAQYPARSEADITGDLNERGKRTAGQVNRLVAAGARVIVVTIPDVGESPYARAQKAAHTDTDRMALIKRLVYNYNASLRLNILNDGRFVGLVLGDETSQAMTIAPAGFGLNNAVDAACTTAVPDCTTATLVAGATGVNYLWADDRRPATTWDGRIGALADARARTNPF
ncbi:MAG: esterase [Aquabacterium sp.]